MDHLIMDNVSFAVKVAIAALLLWLLLISLGQAKWAWRRHDYSMIVIMYLGPILAFVVFCLTYITALFGPLLWMLSLIFNPPDGLFGMPGFAYGTIVFFGAIMLIVAFCAGMGYMITWSGGKTKYTIPTFAQRVGSLVLYVIYGWFFGAFVSALVVLP